MKRTVMIVLLLCLIAGGTAYAVHSFRALRTQGGLPKSAMVNPIPDRFQALRPGLTEQEVLAKVGQPKSRKTNPRYEIKTAQQWAAILATVNAASQDGSIAPTKAYLRAGAELEHRTKDIWQYDAGVNSLVVMSFDGDGHLIKCVAVGSGRAGSS